MLEDLQTACEGCDAPLDASEPALTMRGPLGERRAYECGCGAITVTVVRD